MVKSIRSLLLATTVLCGVLAGLLTTTTPAAAATVTEVTGFGTNPGALRMFRYTPTGLPAGRPLVIALHGCTQMAASYGGNAGWIELADRWRFAVVLPEQQTANNANRCFNWFQAADITRGQGEAESIAQMVRRAMADLGSAPDRVAVTGLSAGAAMTSVLLASYPELFAAGGIVAGLPYRCATTLIDAFSCMNPGKNLTAAQWGDLVRAAGPAPARRPSVSIWHGTADFTVATANQRELVDQWTDVHGISATPTATDTVAGYPHAVYRDGTGRSVVETYAITNMGHGQPVDPGAATGQCGHAHRVRAGCERVRGLAARHHLEPLRLKISPPDEVNQPAGVSSPLPPGCWMVQSTPGREDLVDDESGRITVSGLTKNFGPVKAVDNLSFTVEPGTVTGFLGPNGAGKTTTLRCVLGLVTPNAGATTIGGKPYSALHTPPTVVGALLEASSFHPARTARNHLRVYCTASGIPRGRADEVLDLVGLASAANRKVKGYSMGMRQRLGLAAALLGDPQVLILDEPANGLDPEGIVWLRQFLRHLAGGGRTILVSSHVLSEVEQTVDHIVIINKGTLVRQGKLSELSEQTGHAVLVRTPDPDKLVAALTGKAEIEKLDDGALRVTGSDAAEIGHLAFVEQVELHELATEKSDLEQIFFALTGNGGAVEHFGATEGGAA